MIASFFRFNLTKIVFFVISLMYSFMLIFLGCDFTDTFYWINHFPDFQTDFLQGGTHLIGYLWTNVFGNSLVSVRVLNWLIQVSTVMTVYFVLVHRDNWVKNLNFLSIVIILEQFSIFGGDVVTFSIISISLAIVIKYFTKSSAIYIFCLGLLTAFAFFVRVPNGALFLVVLFILFLIHFHNNSIINKAFWMGLFKIMSIYVLVYTGSSVILTMLFYGNVNNFVVGLQSSFAQQSHDGTHTLPAMLNKILRDANKIFMYLGVLFLFEFLYKLYKGAKTTRYKGIVYFITLCLLGAFLKTEIHSSNYNWNLRLFLPAIIFFVILKGIIKCFKENDNVYKKIVLLISILAFAIVAPLGSDTGLYKLQNVLICFIPVIFIEFNILDELKRNKYLASLTVFFIGFVMLSYFTPFEDRWIYKLTGSFKNEKKLNNIRTSPQRVKYVQDVLNEYLAFPDTSKYMFYGRTSHIFYYLTDQKPLYNYSFKMHPNDSLEIDKAAQAIKMFHPVVFFSTHYPDETASFCGGLTDFEKMLISLGYEEQKKDHFKIYALQNVGKNNNGQ